MTYDDTMELLERMSYWWPSLRLPAGETLQHMVDAWHQVLGDLPTAAVAAVVKSFVDEGSAFAPYPPQIKSRVDAIVGRAKGNQVPDADEAWAEVQEQVRRVGHWTPAEHIEWSHPTVAEAVNHYGWAELCASENPDASRAHFMRIFGMVKQRAVLDWSVSPALLRELVGQDAGSFINIDAPWSDDGDGT